MIRAPNLTVLTIPMLLLVPMISSADRAQLVASLRAMESSARNAEAWLHLRYQPTDAKWLDSIHAENSRTGEPIDSFIESPEAATKESCTVLWRRAGALERVDVYAAGDKT